jgi:hypothetical protein
MTIHFTSLFTFNYFFLFGWGKMYFAGGGGGPAFLLGKIVAVQS